MAAAGAGVARPGRRSAGTSGTAHSLVQQRQALRPVVAQPARAGAARRGRRRASRPARRRRRRSPGRRRAGSTSRRRRRPGRGARAIRRSRRSRAYTRAPSPVPAGSVGARSSRVSSSTAQDSSLSCVHDRRLKLSLPTLAHTSSTTHTLACTYTGVAVVVLHVEHVHPVAAGPAAHLERLLAADLVRRQRERAVDVGVPRHHDDQVQVRVRRAARGRTAAPPRSTTCTGPRGRSAAGPAGSPWSSRARPRTRRRGAKFGYAGRSDGYVRSTCTVCGPHGGGSGGCGGSGSASRSAPAEPVPRLGDRAAQVEPGRVGPAFPERRVERADDRARAAPAGRRATAGSSPYRGDMLDRLRVALVRRVVAAAVAQVDAAGERDVALGRAPGGAARRASGGASRPGAPAGRAAPRRRPRARRSPRWRFSSSLNCSLSRCERHIRPLTHDAAPAAAANSSATVGPSGRSRWSGSPRQSVKNRWSPASSASTSRTSRSK